MVLILEVALPTVADEIHLKNGRIINTSFFWEDGSEIVFEKYGNTVGLPKKSVKEIRSRRSGSGNVK